MRETVIQVGDDYMDFVYKFHQTMLSQQIYLAYEGEVDQDIVKAFTAMAKRNLDQSTDSETTKKRVYHVMVECLQNICKHADDAQTAIPMDSGSGIFMVGYSDDSYTITTGNVINNERIPPIRSLLDELGQMDPDEVKAFYKQRMREQRLSDKAGAGLGFVDIVKRTGNGIDYHFEPVDETTSFMILSSKVARN